MTSFSLRCLSCARTEPATVRALHCPSCQGLFTISYEGEPAPSQPRLPLDSAANRVSLGEGYTPVIRLERLGTALGLGNLWAKLEFMAPTGSFKDRGSAVLISAAAGEGVKEFVEDSSGNAGASLAAYAATAGMKAHIFAPASASKGKLDQIRVFGAELHTVEGPRQAATDAAMAFVRDRGLPYLSHNLSPYFSEGMKAVAYEINGSIASAVDHMVLPVGNGSLLIGARRGFDELIAAGARSSAPSFHAVQSESVMPVVAAINGETWDVASVKPTQASGIAVSMPPRLAEMVSAVRDSGGAGVTVSEDDIVQWQMRLARDAGIFCEPTSAAVFAGLERLIRTGAIPTGSNVLAPVTGSGLKEPLQG